MSQEQTTAPAIVVIATIGVALLNAGAVFLILSAMTNPTSFFVASIGVTGIAVAVDIAAIRALVSRFRAHGRKS